MREKGKDRIIAITNAKGGVGKTGVAVNLAGAAAEAGYRVLAEDEHAHLAEPAHVEEHEQVVDPQAPARLFEALCKKWEAELREVWEDCGRARGTSWRRPGRPWRVGGTEERVRMLAALPDNGEALEKVMRYEAHHAREFARTMEQLEKARALSEAGAKRGRVAVAR